MRGLRMPGACEPDFLAGIHPPFGGPLPSFGHAAAGERQDLERVALGSGGRGLGDEPVPDPGVHGPPGGVGVSAEASLGEIAVRDGAVDADVGEPARAPFGEGGGPAVPARGVFSAVAVPHAVAIAAGWRAGPRVRFDRAVEHLLAPHRPSAARPEGPLRHGERRHGMDDPPRRGRAGRGHGRGFAHGLALARHHGTDFGAELLLRIVGGPESALDPLDERLAVHPLRMAGAVAQLVQGGLVILAGRGELSAFGEHDFVVVQRVERPISRDVTDGHPAVLEDAFGLLVHLPERLGRGCGPGREAGGLLRGEHGVLADDGRLEALVAVDALALDVPLGPSALVGDGDPPLSWNERMRVPRSSFRTCPPWTWIWR